MASVRIENDNRKAIINELEVKTKTVLTAVGMQAVTDIVKYMSRADGVYKSGKRKGKAKAYVVDTGLLKNSITFAVSGEPPAINSYEADEGGGSGYYSGTAPSDKTPTVYIGTNVEYAKYVEYGTSKMGARDFMFTPLRANIGHYKEIMEMYLK